MAKLDYGTLLSFSPIELSIGHIRKPTLQEIADITFDNFYSYEVLLKLTPGTYYTIIKKDEGGKEYWNGLSDDKKFSITLYQLVKEDEILQESYATLFGFFFIEQVIYVDGVFVFISPDVKIEEDDIDEENIIGAMSDTNGVFYDVLNIIQQTCGIANDDEDEPQNTPKFKNKLAEKLFGRIQKAKEKEKKAEDLNMTLPNIISAVSNKHPTINPINVWDLTIFQLLDSFSRLRSNTAYNMNANSVCIWGDSKNKFNVDSWFENIHDKIK